MAACYHNSGSWNMSGSRVDNSGLDGAMADGASSETSILYLSCGTPRYHCIRRLNEVSRYILRQLPTQACWGVDGTLLVATGWKHRS